MIFTPYDILLIPGLLIALWAQWKVKSAYARYSQVGTRSGMTGADVAAHILQDSGIELVDNPQQYAATNTPVCGLEAIGGHLTDHYDPRDRTLRLSTEVFGGQSIAALGIAAHEVGHAIQHARLYSPLMLRNMIYPVTNVASTLAIPIFFVGLILGQAGPFFLQLGIFLFCFAVFFTVITLPVEFNASRRALAALASGGYLTEEELYGARKVLSAAALTYVAAAVGAILQLMRLWLIARDR